VKEQWSIQSELLNEKNMNILIHSSHIYVLYYVGAPDRTSEKC